MTRHSMNASTEKAKVRRKRKLVIIGGSNSILSDGWTAHLDPLVRTRFEVENLSIGATPSVMGAYRVMFTTQIQKGDIVVWEYALNDQVKIHNVKFDEKVLIRHIESTIRYTLNQGAEFLAMVFYPEKHLPSRGRRTSYIELLLDLFRKYKVLHLDVNDYLESSFKDNYTPESLYKDPCHYAPDSLVVRHAGSFVSLTALSPQKQRGMPKSDQAFPSGDLSIINDFEGGSKGSFDNRLLSTGTWNLPPDGTLKAKINPRKCYELVSIVMLAHKDSGAMRITAGGKSMVFSTSAKERNFNKPILRMMAFQAMGKKFIVRGAPEITLSWEHSPKKGFVAGCGFRKVLPQEWRELKSQIVCIVLEGIPQKQTTPSGRDLWRYV